MTTVLHGRVQQPSHLPDKTGPHVNFPQPDFSKGTHARAFPSWASLLPAMPLTSYIPGKRERAGWQNAMMSPG